MNLKNRSILSIVNSLGQLSCKWLDKNFSFRRRAIRRLIEKSFFSKEMAEAALDGLFLELTQDKLWKLLKNELGDPYVLDQFAPESSKNVLQRAHGPSVSTHIFSGNVPNPAIASFVFGMLVKSVNIGKVSRKDEGILDIYLDSLRKFDKKLAATNHLVSPTDKKQFKKYLSQSDLVVAYGSDESIREIKKIIPHSAQFVGYGHRLSFGLYLKEILTPRNVSGLSQRTAHDIWMMDQRGCLSPLFVMVEEGGAVSAPQLAAAVAENLKKLENESQSISAQRILQHESTKNRYAMKRLRGDKTHVWQSQRKGLWLVLCEELKAKNNPLLSGGQGIIEIKSFKKINEVFKNILPVKKYLQAISFEASGQRKNEIAEQLSLMGVSRLCLAGQMQYPPLTWHHDGRPNLSDWVRWTDWEG